jgi:hypothetical protein
MYGSHFPFESPIERVRIGYRLSTKFFLQCEDNAVKSGGQRILKHSVTPVTSCSAQNSIVNCPLNVQQCFPNECLCFLRIFFVRQAYGGLIALSSGAILLQRGIANFLFALPLPFLGVSSLNLAAPLGAAIFFAKSPMGEARDCIRQGLFSTD